MNGLTDVAKATLKIMDEKRAQFEAEKQVKSPEHETASEFPSGAQLCAFKPLRTSMARVK